LAGGDTAATPEKRPSDVRQKGALCSPDFQSLMPEEFPPSTRQDYPTPGKSARGTLGNFLGVFTLKKQVSVAAAGGFLGKGGVSRVRRVQR
jgi:hypothetical protein